MAQYTIHRIWSFPFDSLQQKPISESDHFYFHYALFQSLADEPQLLIQSYTTQPMSGCAGEADTTVHPTIRAFIHQVHQQKCNFEEKSVWQTGQNKEMHTL